MYTCIADYILTGIHVHIVHEALVPSTSVPVQHVVCMWYASAVPGKA